MSLTVDEVWHREFATAPIARRGYDRGEVEKFRRRIANTLAGQDDLTAAEVHHVVFGKPALAERGYDEKDVDAFLDTIEDQLLRATGADETAHQVPPARDQTQATDTRAASDAPQFEPPRDQSRP